MNPIIIEEEIAKRKNAMQKDPFKHQIEAFAALNKVYEEGKAKSKAGLLVLPTGAGKTFTTVKWLYDHALPKHAKIIWLAHTFHLLDQAFETFVDNCIFTRGRERLHIDKFSSHPSHRRVFDIDPMLHDIVIMTTQTAISNWNLKAEGIDGKRVTTKLEEFIKANADGPFFIILDEAHHAPAYGCRTLLTSIKEIAPNVNLIGLSATPTYQDETRRGWLKKLFPEEIIYQADKNELFKMKIMAQPSFIKKDTGRQYDVDDQDYNRIVREHSELPEKIITKLAEDSKRNDYIVSTYLANKAEYGKTIIFADRWFQCNYLVQKLKDKGIKADYVYSHIEADPGSIEARNSKVTDRNKVTLEKFKYGRGGDAIDVLVNVRMLTEGTDVPDTKTVFVTRQTTSQTLFTQMIGRALRGEKAGGGENKKEANIVLFMDNWQRLIDWASGSLGEGGTEEEQIVSGYRPLEYISIHLVDELCRKINSGCIFQDEPFISYLPVGWYGIDLVLNVGEETDNYHSFCMVFNHTKPEYDKFIADVLKPNQLAPEWASESLDPDWVEQNARTWVDKYFDQEQDDIGNELVPNLIKIARHIAQKESGPTFYPFDDRNKLDLDILAKKVLDNKLDDFEQDDLLQQKFNEPGSLVNLVWKNYELFVSAFHGAKRRELHLRKYGVQPSHQPVPAETNSKPPRSLSEEDIKKIKVRDQNRCQACYASGKGIKLQIDHIVSYKLSGDTSFGNSQLLCSVCNGPGFKGINEIDFKINKTSIYRPGDLKLLTRNGNEDVERSLIRLVNFFYHCQAVCKVIMHPRKNGKYYSTWRIELYPGNDPEWLATHKTKLLEHIQTNFNCPHVTDIDIV